MVLRVSTSKVPTFVCEILRLQNLLYDVYTVTLSMGINRRVTSEIDCMTPCLFMKGSEIAYEFAKSRLVLPTSTSDPIHPSIAHAKTNPPGRIIHAA